MNLKIDMQNPAHIKAAAAFFNCLAGVSTEEAPTFEPETIRQTKVSKKTTKTPEAKTPEAKTETAKTETAKTEDKEITREDLIELVSELSSTQDHKNAMRAELDKLGAKNTRSLTTDQYKPFYDFLVKLKSQ